MPNNNTVEIKIDTLDIQTIIIPGIKLKPLSTNKYGTPHLFQVLYGTQFQYILN